MGVIFKGFDDPDVIVSMGKIIKESPVSISKFITNIADIEINDGNITVIKKGVKA